MTYMVSLVSPFLIPPAICGSRSCDIGPTGISLSEPSKDVLGVNISTDVTNAPTGMSPSSEIPPIHHPTSFPEVIDLVSEESAPGLADISQSFEIEALEPVLFHSIPTHTTSRESSRRSCFGHGDFCENTTHALDFDELRFRRARPYTCQVTQTGIGRRDEGYRHGVSCIGRGNVTVRFLVAFFDRIAEALNNSTVLNSSLLPNE